MKNRGGITKVIKGSMDKEVELNRAMAHASIPMHIYKKRRGFLGTLRKS